MRALKVLSLVLTVLLLIVAAVNGERTEVLLFVKQVKLSLGSLIFLSFLVGFVAAALLMLGQRMSMRGEIRRLRKLNEELEAQREEIRLSAEEGEKEG